MATVYLADDIKHRRKVALKVLSDEAAAAIGAARFLAEIGTTASLQHPHILPLFDSGDVEDLLFYVMPYVEGGSLEDRLKRVHQLSVDEAIRTTVAVAHALDYAHRHGVVHRDIKPANILLHDGQPVIADFGIALAASASGADRLTATGISLGTPLYMSPEQATGERRIGPATDIYALGCVLYEMLVGEPPYTGSTQQAILAKILTGDAVSATTQRKSVPLNVDAAIRKALEKLPADRFATASDFAKSLELQSYRDDVGKAAAVSHVPWKRIALALAATTILLSVANVWSLTSRRYPETPAVARFDITPADSQRLLVDVGLGVDFALSPDGSWIVYVGATPGGGTRLLRRELKDLRVVPLPGTEGSSAPAVSPDGRSLAFMADGGIRTLSLTGGAPVTVVAAGGPPAWGSDGMIYFARDTLAYRVPAAGGDPVIVSTKPLENVTPRHLDVLPGGRGLLFTAFVGTPAQAHIAVANLGTGEAREILTGTMAQYSPTGHVIYTNVGGTLLAAPFDVAKLEVTGPSVAIAEGVAVNRFWAPQFAVSPSGAFLYVTGAGSASELVWVNRDGHIESVDPEWVGELGSPALSPDGKRVAVALQGQQSMDIWLKQLDRGPSTKLTLDGGRNDYPVWTPDGASVSFSSDRASRSFDLWTKPADRSGDPVLEMDLPWAIAETAWSPDGQWFVYRTSTNVRGAGDILGRRGGPGAPSIPLVASNFTELGPTISPNGRWMAYSSNETGQREVFVVPFPNTKEARWPVSVAGGSEPAWSRDGRELFYRNRRGYMVAVRVETESGFSTRETTTLFADTAFERRDVRRQYDVAPDGKRFIMVRPLSSRHERRLILVQNFFEELKRLAPK
jgi:serine/threonine-protein kinase